MFLSILATLAIGLQADAPGSREVDRIIRAHEATITAIRTIHVQVKSFAKKPTLRGEGAEKQNSQYDWYFDDKDDERIRSKDLTQPRTRDGDEPGLKDIANVKNQFRALLKMDPERPPPLGEFSMSKAQGVMAPRQSGVMALGQVPRIHCLWGIDVGEEDLSLAKACKAAQTVKLLRVPSQSPSGCYELRLDYPNLGLVVHCWLDPKAGLLLRRVDHDLAAKRDRKATSNTLEVMGFESYGLGTYFPKEVNGRLTEGGRAMTYRYEFEVKSINQPLPPDTFAVKFPDWLHIVNSGTGKIHIWGADDKPRQTFNTTKEFNDWFTPRFVEANGLNRTSLSGRLLSWPVLASALAIVAAVIALFVRRRGQHGGVR